MTNVLIVDDSEELLEVFSHLLKTKGYLVKSESSFEAALDILEQVVPDIVILDVMLDGGDGRELCKKIKEEYKNIAVILVSSNPLLLENYKECSADVVVEKPFTTKTILGKLNEVSNKYGLIAKS